MVLQNHGQPAGGLVLWARMFRMKWGYGVFTPTGYLSVKRVGNRWGLWLNSQALTQELEVFKGEGGEMPYISGPWQCMWVTLLPNPLPPGSRAPIASLYTSQSPYFLQVKKCP